MNATAKQFAIALERATGDVVVFRTVISELERVWGSISADPEVLRFFTARTVSAEVQANALRETLYRTLDERTQRFLHTLIEHGQCVLLPAIIAEARGRADAVDGIAHIAVESAVPLNERQRETAERVLRARLGRAIAVEYMVVPERIGGLCITVDRVRQWDRSVQGAFDRLRKHISDVGVTPRNQ